MVEEAVEEIADDDQEDGDEKVPVAVNLCSPPQLHDCLRDPFCLETLSSIRPINRSTFWIGNKVHQSVSLPAARVCYCAVSSQSVNETSFSYVFKKIVN